MPKPVVSTLPDRRTTAEFVVEALRDAILRGDFEDNEELNQATLAKQFGTARVPVREALRQLEGEGLVVSRAHHRAVVRTLTRDRVLEAIDIRMMLELYLLKQSIGKLTEADFDRLEAICDEMDRLKDPQRWLVKNREFHEQLYAPSGAEIATALNRQVSGLAGRYLKYPADRWEERKKTAGVEHRRIVAAARKGDVAAATRELRQHISETRDAVGSLMAEAKSTGES